MFKKSLIYIILIVGIYQVFTMITKKTEPAKIEEITYNHPEYGIPDKILIDSKNIYGKFTNFKVYRYYNTINRPWDMIDVIPDHVYEYKFYIKIRANIDMIAWKKILPTIEYQDGYLSLETNDEDVALAIVNMVISNSLKNMSLEDIIKNQLIDITIKQLKERKIVRPKIVSQIEENLEFINDEEQIDFDYGESSGQIEYGEPNGDYIRPQPVSSKKTPGYLSLFEQN